MKKNEKLQKYELQLSKIIEKIESLKKKELAIKNLIKKETTMQLNSLLKRFNTSIEEIELLLEERKSTNEEK